MGMIDQYKGVIGSHRNVGMANRFVVRITAPPVTGYSAQDLDFLVESATMPGHSISTTEYTTNRETLKNPYTFIDEDVSMTFLLTNDYYARVFFDAWMQQVFNKHGYFLGYKNQYAGTVEIVHLTQRNQETYGVKLLNAYPISIAATEYSQGTSDIVRVTVTFAYDRHIITSLSNFSDTSLGGSLSKVFDRFSSFQSATSDASAILNAIGAVDVAKIVSDVGGSVGDVADAVSQIGTIQNAMTELASGNLTSATQVGSLINQVQKSMNSLQGVLGNVTSLGSNIPLFDEIKNAVGSFTGDLTSNIPLFKEIQSTVSDIGSTLSSNVPLFKEISTAADGLSDIASNVSTVVPSLKSLPGIDKISSNIDTFNKVKNLFS